MQTFLPFANYRHSAIVLDRARLGKQRVETLQIMKGLVTGAGWINHPATKMWEGYEESLLYYQDAVCMEWRRRGYADTCFEKTENLFIDAGSPGEGLTPPWLGDPAFHVSHQSNLMRKNPDYYGHFFSHVPDDIEYVWPTAEEL